MKIKDKSKNEINLYMLNARRKYQNKKPISKLDYDSYIIFKDKLLKHLKSSSKKRVNGYLSVDAFLFIKKYKK